MSRTYRELPRRHRHKPGRAGDRHLRARSHRASQHDGWTVKMDWPDVRDRAPVGKSLRAVARNWIRVGLQEDLAKDG